MEIVNRVESVAFDKTQCTDNTAKGVLVCIVYISDSTKLRNYLSVNIQNQIATSLGHIFECTLSSTGDVSAAYSSKLWMLVRQSVSRRCRSIL